MDIKAELLAALAQILGEKPEGYYFAGLFFSLLGIAISLYHASRSRDKLSENTPFKFSWYFLIWDNFRRIIVTLIVMFILFRMFDLTEIWQMVGLGVGVALSLDKIIKLMMDKWDFLCNLLSQDRSELPAKAIIINTENETTN